MPVAAAAAGVVQWASTSSSDSNHLSTGIKLHYSLFTESGTCPREVLSIQALARRALDGVQNAYCVGYSPEGTGVGAAITVDPQSAWTTLVHTLRQSSAPAFSLIAQPHLLLVLKRSLQQRKRQTQAFLKAPRNLHYQPLSGNYSKSRRSRCYTSRRRNRRMGGWWQIFWVLVLLKADDKEAREIDEKGGRVLWRPFRGGHLKDLERVNTGRCPSSLGRLKGFKTCVAMRNGTLDFRPSLLPTPRPTFIALGCWVHGIEPFFAFPLVPVLGADFDEVPILGTGFIQLHDRDLMDRARLIHVALNCSSKGDMLPHARIR